MTKNMPTANNFMENYKLCCSNSKTRMKVKSLGQDKCLQFNADNLDAEDWIPLTRALGNDRTLHMLNIKSEHHGKKWRSSLIDNVKPSIYKRNVIQDLIEAITICMKGSTILSTILLQSLPIDSSHIDILSNGIKACKSLQHLAITRTKLNDKDINSLCNCIRTHMGLQTVNLTGSGISKEGASYVADLIRSQRLVRYSETWKQSLRYREPNPEIIPGIRRITLNDNPEITDEGYSLIKHELMDDLWIKAIDIQNCGLTNISGELSLELLNTNTTILILDIRRNDNVSAETTKTIKTLLSNRYHEYIEKECDRDEDNYNQTYCWLDGSQQSTNRSDICSSRKPNSEFSLNTIKNNTKITNLMKSNSLTTDLYRRNLPVVGATLSLTEEIVKTELKENQKQREQLAEKLVKEWNRRKSIEKERDKLRKDLNDYITEINNSIGKNRLRTSKSLNLSNSNKTINTNTTKSLSTLTSPVSTKAKKSKKRNKRIGCKNKSNQKKLQQNEDVDDIRKGKRKMNYEGDLSNTIEEKKENRDTQQKHQIKQPNQNELQNIQENLDKIKIKHLQFDKINTVFDRDEEQITGGDQREDNLKNEIIKRDYRDLSPTSRSQWILKELMNGSKTRNKINLLQNLTDKNVNFDAGKNLQNNFDNKWDIAVTL